MASRNLVDGKVAAIVVALAVLSLAWPSLGARRLPALLIRSHVGDQVSYHGGAVLHGDIPVTVVWYGKFKPAQKAIVVDFLLSLTPPSSSSSSSSPPNTTTPTAAKWWSTIATGYLSSNATAGGGGGGGTNVTSRVVLANQTSDEEYSLGKSLTLVEVFQLAAGVVPGKGDLVVVLTDQDVVVEGFCSVRCGVHGSDAGAGYAYAWVGNAETECPGQCAWPFAKPAYGPKDPALVPPNGDVGADGMVATLAGMVAGAVTNPFGDGYYLGDKDAALEACSACAGAYGSGSYPGYAGKVLVDDTTGGSYNAVGAHGRKYLLPAVYDPATSRCTTLV
ncbi:protein PHOSPHATE-INDUCED 1-like [Oryza brachyantha]|uniref:Phi-1-like phosphate-induced protein n=1 Tax=Oryza brachyantha TaxID=4533 RepID=J3MCI4_ORYBR|nr:protein PHOSPHATE-INDUCED 1-like [Oryza brachyantha]